MKTRATLALAAVAGLAAAANAQEIVRVTYNWVETNAGTTQASTQVGAGNGVVDPGEGARIVVQLTYFGNNNAAAGIGQTTSINVGGFTSGTVLGWGSAFIDLTGTNGDATGSWTTRQISSVLNFGQALGNVLNGGAQLQGVGGGQSMSPGVTSTSGTPPVHHPDEYVANLPNQGNPLAGTVGQGVNFMRSVWTPGSYANRTINWKAGNTPAVNPSNETMKMIVGYQTTTSVFNDGDIDTQDTTVTYYSSIFSKTIAVDYGNGVNIPVAPAPSSIALLGLGALVAGRRRR